LERTRGFFTGRSDESCSGAPRFKPCSGAARFRPADSRAAPLWSTASTVATRSPARSGAESLTPATTEVGPWPPPTMRETWTSGAPPPWISNDCRRRGRRQTPPPAVRSASMPSPTTFPATGASARSLSRGGRSHRKARGRKPATPPTFSWGRRLAGCGSLRLRCTRPAGHHTRADRPLVLLGRASCLSRARTHFLVARGHRRLPR
jgi:hypothetical protein